MQPGTPRFGGANMRRGRSAAVRLKPTALIAAWAMSPQRRHHWLVRMASQASACEQLVMLTPVITYLPVHRGHQAHGLEARVS